MKNIFKIYKKDVVKICTNWVALIVVTGLIILPSLYAWFNIKSSWDPYGNTKGIKVAIVNEDKGATYADKKIDVGESLIEELKKNDALGWQFVNSEEAERGVEDGKYFASITIPSNFSEDAISLTTKNIVKPNLIYTVNESTNAIAPKITDKGVETLKQNIDSTLVKTVDGVIFKIFNNIGEEYINERPKIKQTVEVLYELNNNSGKIGDLINKAYDGTITVNDMINKINAIIPNLTDTLNRSSDILQSSESFLNNTKDTINKVAPMIKEDLILGNNLINGALEIGNSITENTDKDIAIKDLQFINDKLSSGKAILNYVNNLLQKINKDGKLDQTITKINGVVAKIDNLVEFNNQTISNLNGNGAITSDTINKIKEKLQGISNGISGIINSYDSVILPNINASMDKLIALSNSAEGTVEKTKEALPKIEETLGLFKKGTTISKEKLGELKKSYPEIQKSLSDLVGKIKKVDNGNNVDNILSLLTNNWENESDYLSNPVNITENRLFKLPNYGSAMSPFYTTLALWVGGLILVSILTVDIKGIKEKEKIKTYEIFLGKYLTFITIGALQGFVVTFGDIYLLKTYVLNKWGFILFGMLVSILFMTIIYSTVSVFGNVGKAICIIFLVLQVAASGGTFPVQVMSDFFKGINPFLPFKYAINGMRYLVAGGMDSLFVSNVKALIIMAIPFFIVGIFFKKIFNKRSKKFIDKLRESEIVEH